MTAADCLGQNWLKKSRTSAAAPPQKATSFIAR